MTAKTAAPQSFRELDARSADGLDVALLWSSADDALVVRVLDAKSGERFELDVGADEALDAYRHPFAYQALRQPGPVEGDLTSRLEAMLAGGDVR